MSIAEIEAALDAMKQEDPDFSLAAMKGGRDVDEVAKRAFVKFFDDNPLMGPRLPSLWRIQSEVLEMAIDLMHGGDAAAASMTTGGSESIFCAVHAMREWARATKPAIVRPELVIPYSAHAAFSKSCHYMDIELKRIPLDAGYRADMAAMADAVTDNTIGIVGSAPNWPYGRYDPIQALAALAASRGVWMHVDACVGGFIAPFAERLGLSLPLWDLRVPGVCSISADLHKYGFAPKPASVVVYASEELHAYQPHVVTDWPTGPYRTETVVGTRPGGAVAGAWAVMHYLGQEGFLRTTRQMLNNKEQLTAGVREIPGLTALDTDLAQFIFHPDSERLDAQSIAAGLRQRGWFVFGVQEPPMISLVVSAVESEVVDRFLTDLEATVAGIDEQAAATGELNYAS
jgi:glutamate/tyrosine decarboxylase-like PLP-dependent enzyme